MTGALFGQPNRDYRLFELVLHFWNLPYQKVYFSQPFPSGYVNTHHDSLLLSLTFQDLMNLM